MACLKRILTTTPVTVHNPEPALPCPARLDDLLSVMLGRRNICSTEFVTIQDDHTVQGGHVLGPVTGERPGAGTGNADKSGPRIEKGRGPVAGAVPFLLRD